MRCSTCGKPIDDPHAALGPFCSDRCRQVDLGRWLDEKYSFSTEREIPPNERDERNGRDEE